MTQPKPGEGPTVAIEPHPRGAVLNVRAQPGARRNAVQGVHAGALKVSVTQVAERGRANDAVLATLGAALDIPVSRLELVAGATNRRKRVLVAGMEPGELVIRVAEAITASE